MTGGGGRPLRVVVAKPGLDGHDVGAKLLCRALMEAGMEVVYTGLRQTPDAIVRAAVQESPGVLGLSILSGSHLVLTRRVIDGLREAGLGDLPVVVGGNIPARDRGALEAMGAAAVLATGTPFARIAGIVREVAGRAAAGGAAPDRRDAAWGEAKRAAAGGEAKRAAARGTKGGKATGGSGRPAGARGDIAPVRWESGLEIRPVYTPAEVEASGGLGAVGEPGVYPYTRGIHPLMYRKRPWTMRQYSGFGTAAETHERFLWLLRNGQTGLNVAFDLPTQCGLDSDDPAAEGEVGRVGMAVDSLADIEEAFADIDLNAITVSLTINGAAVPILGMVFAMARKRGFALETLRGTAQNDILKEFIGRGTWIYPVEPSIRLVGDTLAFCARHAPKYSPVSVCGYHIRESGATPAQEIAYAFAIARAYLDHTIARGLDADAVARGISFNFDIHGNLWEQVAKFRAARRLWARILKERYGAREPRAMQLRMIAGGGGGGLTIQQPENNIVRGAYYALASALSGTQTMALCSFDEAYTIPSEHAARLSLRTMQILMDEVGACDTVDPLAGSWFVETTTNEMERAIEGILARIDREGGIVRGIAEGRVQAAVNREAWKRERAIEEGRIPKVGVNRYVTEDEEERDVAMHPYREEEARKQIERLARVRRERDGREVAARLGALREAARSGANVMPAAIDAVEAYATVGEICGTLAEVFGRYEEPVRF